MGRSSSSADKKDGPLELAGLILLVFAVLIFLVWMAASTRIVVIFTPLLRASGSLWMWLPGESGAPSALQVYRTARIFLERPHAVDFFSFMSYMNLCIMPVTTMLTLLVSVWLAATLSKAHANVFRRFGAGEKGEPSAGDLMRGLSQAFTGTAPILHIRKEIAQHKDPLWARQRFPEEVLFGERVDGEPLVGKTQDSQARAPSVGADITNDAAAATAEGVAGGLEPSPVQARVDVIERWFKGLESTPGWAGGVVPGQRWRSRTLGRHVVDLTNDADKKIFSELSTVHSFADRFSDVGRVMFGLLCAHAFGGKEGIEDYRRARDQLNNSCRGAKHGLPRLDVAQWIVDKYRTNDLARRMFAVHHWEYTYLFELFVQAKRRGKIPDSEFRWLKPADRVLWYVLNTIGRFTPHTDSAAAFNMHAFERKCVRRKRWPIRLNGRTGRLEHSIFVKGAVGVDSEGRTHGGLVMEFERWMNGTDENDDDWWKDTEGLIWRAPSQAVSTSLPVIPLPPDTEAARQVLAENSFDSQQSQARQRAQAEQQDAERAAVNELARLMGTQGTNTGASGGGAAAGRGSL
jgi:hypothetical protein